MFFITKTQVRQAIKIDNHQSVMPLRITPGGLQRYDSGPKSDEFDHFNLCHISPEYSVSKQAGLLTNITLISVLIESISPCPANNTPK